MLIIDRSDRKKWNNIENDHINWWEKHLINIENNKKSNLKNEIEKLTDKELEFLVFILNDYCYADVENFKKDIKKKSLLEVTPNIKKVVIRELDRNNDKKINDNWKEVIKKEELGEEFLKFLNDHILKSISTKELKKKTWENHLKKLTDEEKEFCFFLLKKNDLTTEEINLINKATSKENVKNIIDRLNLDEKYLLKGVTEKKDEIKLAITGKKEAITQKYEYQINSLLDIETDIEKVIKKIFDYDKFSKDEIEGRHKIISAMNVPVCPYCGRQYTTNYSNNEKTTADLDHYYPKSKYPYLALSLYNFVPSCLYCNRIKNNKENHLYPYDEEFGDNAVFRTSIDSINGILESKTDKFNVEIKIIDLKESESNCYKERLENSIKDVFKLEEVYKTSHNQYIIDMLHTIEHYPDTYLDTIAEIFEDTKEKDKELKELKEKNEHEKDEKIECQIKQTIKEIEDINTNKTKLKIQLQEILRKPYFDRIDRKDTLSKLTKDILTEYGFYK